MKENKLVYSALPNYKIRIEGDYTFTNFIDGRVFTIPKGFVSDGASIPRILWPVFGGAFSTKLLRASVEHDYLISLNYNGDSRDLHFYSALMDSDVDKWKAKLMYHGVVSWRKFKKFIDKLR